MVGQVVIDLDAVAVNDCSRTKVTANDREIMFVYLTYFPAIAFWFLDGYFLRQERLYRALYDQVRSLSEENIDFSMDTTKMDHVDSWAAVTFSRTLLPFHGVIVISVILVTFVSLCLQHGGI